MLELGLERVHGSIDSDNLQLIHVFLLRLQELIVAVHVNDLVIVKPPETMKKIKENVHNILLFELAISYSIEAIYVAICIHIGAIIYKTLQYLMKSISY